MNQVKFEEIKQVVKKYHDFLFSLPGLRGVGYDDNEITIYVKPENVESVKRSVKSNLDGVTVLIKPRTQLFHF